MAEIAITAFLLLLPILNIPVAMYIGHTYAGDIGTALGAAYGIGMTVMTLREMGLRIRKAVLGR